MKAMTVKRGDVNWCDNGYAKITTQEHNGAVYHFGSIGSAICLLDENLDPVSGNGYHSIDLTLKTASIGAKEFRFTEHLDLQRTKTRDNGSELASKMTKREAFTMAAMQNILSSYNPYEQGQFDSSDFETTVTNAIGLADAMLEGLDK